MNRDSTRTGRGINLPPNLFVYAFCKIFPLGRMGPIAPPYHPLRCYLQVSTGDLGHVGVSRRADLGVLIDVRQLTPGPALADQPADALKSGPREAPQVIEKDRRCNALQQILMLT